MHHRTLRLLAAFVLTGGLVSAGASSGAISRAAAQDYNPEDGAVWVPPPDDTPPPVNTAPPPVEQPPPQQQQQGGTPAWYNGGATGTTQGSADPERPPSVGSSSSSSGSEGSGDADGRDDHERVINRLAVGFMGISQVPIGSFGAGTLGADTVTAPAIGIRYWVGELVGVDLGVGLGYIGGTAEAAGVSFPADNAFALTVHGGLPLAVFHAQHYKFIVVPELNIGFSTGTAFGMDPDQDRGRSGFLFQIGGRLGTEIHFGFMDIPQLSLQASVGLYFNYSSAGIGGNRVGGQGASASTFSLATSVQGEPWDILLGSLNALYYF